MRDRIFELVKDYKDENPDKDVSFETECRVDDLIVQQPDGSWQIKKSLLGQMNQIGISVTLGMGIESVNPLVAEGCYNKHLPPLEEIEKLWELIREKYPNISLLPHVWFGARLLRTNEQIEDAAETIDFCIENGLTDVRGRVILMVMNYRPLSPEGRMFERLLPELGSSTRPIYVPSIWSVGKILRRIGKEKATSTMIRGFITAGEGVIVVEPCCEQTNGLYQLLLDWTGGANDWRKLEEVYSQVKCSHRIAWKKKIEREKAKPPPPLAQRLLVCYDRLVREVLREDGINDKLLDRGQRIIERARLIKRERRATSALTREELKF